MKTLIVAAAMVTALIIPTAADATPLVASCVAIPPTVTASGLPVNKDIDVWIADVQELVHYSVGRADADGTLTITVPLPDSPTTYTFVAHPHGSKPFEPKFFVLTSCTA